MTDLANQLDHLEALQYGRQLGEQTTTYGGKYVSDLRDAAHRMYTRPIADRLKASKPAGVTFDEAVADLRALTRAARNLARIDTLIRGLEHAAAALGDDHPLAAGLHIKLGLARGDRTAERAEADLIRERIINALEPDDDGTCTHEETHMGSCVACGEERSDD